MIVEKILHVLTEHIIVSHGTCEEFKKFTNSVKLFYILVDTFWVCLSETVNEIFPQPRRVKKSEARCDGGVKIKTKK